MTCNALPGFVTILAGKPPLNQRPKMSITRTVRKLGAAPRKEEVSPHKRFVIHAQDVADRIKALEEAIYNLNIEAKELGFISFMRPADVIRLRKGQVKMKAFSTPLRLGERDYNHTED